MDRRDLLKVSPLAVASAVGYVARAEVTRVADAKVLFDVRNYGATGDGKTVDSPAVNRAIEIVASAGGGTLVFPAGTYVCFTIRLKSGVDLWLSNGCVILAADSPRMGETSGYRGGTYDPAGPAQEWEAYQDYGHNHWANSLFYAVGQHDFAIYGRGLIWGKGLSSGAKEMRDGTGGFIAEQAGVGEQNICVEELPECFAAGFQRVEGWALCAAGYGRGEPDDR